MRRKDQIAIIILTYNRFDEFKIALKSAFGQKGVDFHIFVFDNGSKKPVCSLIPKNSNATCIRHKKNIGFAANFKFATDYVKKKGFKFSFLLGDDDYIAYSYALRDLFELMKNNPGAHVVKGGYVEFVNWPPQFTRILTFNDSKKFSKMTEINKAITMHVTSYSGVLYNNEFFDPHFSPYDDLITPFIGPVFKILTKRKFCFLPNKITICVKTDHMQLATDVYNEKVSNQDALEKVFSLLGKKYKRYVSLVELINFKIYSHNRKNKEKYYKECLKLNIWFKSVPFIICYYTPSVILKKLRSIYKNIKCYSIERELLKNHLYLNKFLLK